MESGELLRSAGPKIAGPKTAQPRTAGPKTAQPKTAGPKIAEPGIAGLNRWRGAAGLEPRGNGHSRVGMMVVVVPEECTFGRMARRDLRVLDAAETAADMINDLIDRPSGRRMINTTQLRRSVHSISANIVEGFGRGTDGDRARMLRIARGEAEETMQHLAANRRANRISVTDYWAIRNKCAVVVKMLNGLIR